MRRYVKSVPVFFLLLFGAVASGPAMAQHYGHGGGVRFGISLGFPLYGPGYYPGPYYSYPAYAYPAPAYAYPGPAYAYPAPATAPSAAYVERGPQAAPAQPQGDWYYCADSKSYYPYVRDCPGGWQRVPATPPSR
jgi:hypothetical protein